MPTDTLGAGISWGLLLYDHFLRAKTADLVHRRTGAVSSALAVLEFLLFAVEIVVAETRWSSRKL